MESQKPQEMASNKEEAELVLQTWDKMKSDVDTHSTNFFNRVFAIDPSVKDKFDHSKKIDPSEKNTYPLVHNNFVTLLAVDNTDETSESVKRSTRMINHGRKFFDVLCIAAKQYGETGRVYLETIPGRDLMDVKHRKHHIKYKHFEAYSKALEEMLNGEIAKLDENARKAWGKVHQTLIDAMKDSMRDGRIQENNFTFSQYTAANLESWIQGGGGNPHNHDPLPHNPELVTLEKRTFDLQTPFSLGDTPGEQDEDKKVKVEEEVSKLKVEVNGWVKENTHKIIEDFLEGFPLDHFIKNKISLNAGALHFKGEWEEKLVVCDNKRDFHPLTGEPFKATYLTSRNKKQYVKKLDNYTVLSLPYDDKGQQTCYSMLFFLPDDDKKLDDLIEFEALKNELGMYEHTIISDSLPDEKVEVGEFMIPKLTFSIKSDDVYKEDFICSFIEVNEEGTTAVVAYASYLDLNREKNKGGSSGSFVPAHPTARSDGEKIDFVADRPFLAFIRENKTGHILFFNQVVCGPLED